MNRYEKRNFNKARRLINWSFVLMIVPAISITFAAIAKSILHDIPEQESDDDEDRIARLSGRGAISIFLTCVFMTLMLVLYLYSITPQ